MPKKLKVADFCPGDGMGIVEDTAKILLKECSFRKPKVVVDLGTGMAGSLSLFLSACPNAKGVYSVDDRIEFTLEAKLRMVNQGVSLKKAHLIHAPLQRICWRGLVQNWYSLAALDQIPGGIELLFVDGPEGTIGRTPAIPVLCSKLAKRSVVFIDDCKRPAEKLDFDRWKTILAFTHRKFKAEILDTSRGLGKITLS